MLSMGRATFQGCGFDAAALVESETPRVREHVE
jgi:hypothetical protein